MLIFHSPTQRITVPRSRMHHMDAYCARLCASALGIDPFQVHLEDPDRLKRLLPPGAPPLTAGQPSAFYQAMADYLLLSTDGLRHPATGQYLDKREVILNTALVSGSDPVRLLVRLDGQGGRHSYVEGANRAWLAALIDEGVEGGVLRRGRYAQDEERDWPAVAALLRSRADEPVVVSDSEEAEEFPSAAFGAPFVPPSVARASTVAWAPIPRVRPDWSGQEGEARWAQWKAAVWENLSLADQWDYAMQGLRQFLSHELELRPEDWRTYRFGHGYNAFQLLSATFV